MQPLARQREFSRGPASPLREPPPTPATSPRVLGASPRPPRSVSRGTGRRGHLPHTSRPRSAWATPWRCRVPDSPWAPPAARCSPPPRPSPSCPRGDTATRSRDRGPARPPPRAARSGSGSDGHWRTPPPGCPWRSSPSREPPQPGGRRRGAGKRRGWGAREGDATGLLESLGPEPATRVPSQALLTEWPAPPPAQ